MGKINFGVLADALKVLDTDEIDIARKTAIINPDGTEGRTDISEPLYTGIACHVSFVTADNPDANSVDVKPIIKGLRINCPLETDLQKGDYITARKLDNEGNVLEVYTGTIGVPTVTESRKIAEMEMKAGV